MTELDRTQMRIIGALIEKDLATPENYPLTENTLIAACNQKSNRDPEMSLETFEVHGALVSLMTADWAKTSSAQGGRATRYAHRLDSHHAVDDREKAVLCELLIRGPQAPGALKSRVARLGFHGTPADIEATLHAMVDKPTPLVERLAKRPRERDNRWRHLLGAMDEAHAAESTGAAPSTPSAPSTPPSTPSPTPTVDPDEPGLLARIEELEHRVADLESRLN